LIVARPRDDARCAQVIGMHVVNIDCDRIAGRPRMRR
jgi:hypothetical protein